MQTTDNLTPVDSDVNCYLKKDQFMFDNDIADLFEKFKINALIRQSNIKKRAGNPADRLVFDLIFVPFLMLTTVFIFVRTQFEDSLSAKNKYYRLLENARYNWGSFILNIAFRVWKTICETSENSRAKNDGQASSTPSFFVVDDTITQVRGKLVESASYIYDHVTGKTVLGFQKLVLGTFDSLRFMPICSHNCASKHKPNAKSKAKKYKKIPKIEKIPNDCPGAMEREMLDKTKLELMIKMLKQAMKRGFTASTVLFDSWFCFNSFISMIKNTLKLDVICQLKNLPNTNKYFYQGKPYSLAQLYDKFAVSRLRMVKKHNFKRSVMTVCTTDSNLKLKIVFIKNEGKDKWHAFAATDTGLSADKILEYYAYRWSIECFFKSCKQYLNLGKEQMSNLDSIIACDALVFLRYILLTYLAFASETTVYKKFDELRMAHSINTFGSRLLKHFFDKLNDLIHQVIDLIEKGAYDQAMEMLKEVCEGTNGIAAGGGS